MIRHFLALLGLVVSIEACFLYSLPTPEDYVNAGRKWLTFKNIPDGKAVQIDTMQEFQEFMQKRGKLAVLLFYDDRTTHSKQLFPLWEGLAMTLDGVAKIGCVSVSTSFGPTLANICNVNKVPSVYLIRTPSGRNHQSTIVVEEYTNGISIEGINKAVLMNLTNDYIDYPLSNIEFNSIEERTTRLKKRHIVVLLTRKKSTTDLFKTLSYKYSTDFSFVQIPYSAELATDLMEKFQLSKPKDWGPLVFLYDCSNKAPTVIYDGKKFDVSSLSVFLDQHVLGETVTADAQNSAIQEMLSEVRIRCHSFSRIESQELKDLLVSGETLIVGILNNEEDGTKVSVMKNIACSFSTDSSVQKIVWMRIANVGCLEKLLGFQLSEGFIFISPSTSLFSYQQATISNEAFLRFQNDKPDQAFSFDPDSF